ncbi:MAG: asparagine synthase-related protein [Candidatus Thermoplasmatota archaeon]|nr:asparagine synthase-related protein [Candidatus Thermoplasmatota archaeon]
MCLQIIYSDVRDLTTKLKTLLEGSVRNNLADGILLSGGLDTSILAYLGSKHKHLKAFTIAINPKAPDIKYSTKIAKKLKLKHHVYYGSIDRLLQTMPELIKILKTFDPMELRNSVVVYLALKLARANHIKSVMTGDGADELFAGYSYMFDKSEKELHNYTSGLSKVMHFSSVELGRRLGVEIKTPYLDSNIVSFALELARKFKIQARKGKIYGKFILRKAFENALPKEIIWRVKTPIEVGSGSTQITKVIESKICDGEFRERKEKYNQQDKVKIRDKEQLYYYEIYRSVVGIPYPTNPKSKKCPFCNSTITYESSKYCKVCGAYPI